MRSTKLAQSHQGTSKASDQKKYEQWRWQFFIIELRCDLGLRNLIGHPNMTRTMQLSTK